MITDFASELKEMTYDGILTCAQIVTFAKHNNIELEKQVIGCLLLYLGKLPIHRLDQ